MIQYFYIMNGKHKHVDEIKERFRAVHQMILIRTGAKTNAFTAYKL